MVDYTTRQAAAKLGINPMTLLRWIKDGKIIAARKGLFTQGYRFNDSDIVAVRSWRSSNPTEPLDLTKPRPETPEEKTAREQAAYRKELELWRASGKLEGLTPTKLAPLPGDFDARAETTRLFDQFQAEQENEK